MTNSERTKLFIFNNNNEIIKDYHDKLFENLKDLNEKEEKYILWEYIIIFLYLFASNITFTNLSLGPITISNTATVVKILPLIFIYTLYNLHSITSQKKEVMLAFEIISAERFNEEANKQNTKSFMSRIYRPYAFSNALANLIREKPHIIESIIGFVLIFPIVIIGLAPYIIAISMLIDLNKNYMTDTLGMLSFWLTLWLYLIVIFHIIIESIKNYKENLES